MTMKSQIGRPKIQCTSELGDFGGFFFTTVLWVSGRSEGMKLKFLESSGADAELFS